jgi:hypothetical protein
MLTHGINFILIDWLIDWLIVKCRCAIVVGFKICEIEDYTWKFLFHSYVDFHLHVELKEKIEVQDSLK